MGEVFAGRYELLSPIAEGGMGAVWQVRDLRAGEVRAAKLLRHSDAGTLLRFMREQSTRIHHPHVVTPLSWVGEDDTVLFTMPLVRGGSVADLVGDWGPLPEAWVATVLDQTLAALEAVHRAGVVHRDVKPANLLLEPTGRARPHVRLTDFGIAASVDQPRMTSATTALGTPGYVAPEQRAGADPDPRQDLYALATVGLEMLLGHAPPFSAEEQPDSELGGLLVAVRDPDPRRRPPDAAALRAALAPLVPATWSPGDVEVLDQLAPDLVGPDAADDGPRQQPTRALAATPPPEAGRGRTPATRQVLTLVVLGATLLVVAAVLLL